MAVALRRSTAAVAAALVLLTACGGGSSDTEKKSNSEATAKADTKEKSADAKADKKKTSKKKDSEEVPVADFDGTPAPETLSNFQCAAVKKTWAATGVVANSDKNPASFQVTVYVGPGEGDQQTARTVRLDEVAGGASVSFEIEKIPAQGDGPCHVQVLLLDD